MQHELMPRLAIDVGYFKRSFGNFQVTQLRGQYRRDFDRFCVTAPLTAVCPTAVVISSKGSTISTRTKVGRARRMRRWRETSVTRASTGTAST